MDKSRDARRGARRFSRQQIINKQPAQKQQLLAGLVLGGGVGEDFVSLEKPKKKERLIKKLSVVNKASSCYEDSDMSDRENEFPSQSHSSISNATTKRHKLPKKFFSDCNVVDHSSVPRKLRSAMKKRNRESIYPPLPNSKKLNHTIAGVKSLKKDCLKKSKLNMIKQGSVDRSQKQAAGPITKDEEEVVETLYALAGMFPDNDRANKAKLKSDPSEAKPSGLPEHRESTTLAIEVTKEDLSSTCPLKTSRASSSTNGESLQKETVIVNSLKDTVEEKPNLHESEIFHKKTEGFVSSVNLDSMVPLLPKREQNNNKPLCSPVKFHDLPEPCLVSGKLEWSTQNQTSLHRRPALSLGASTSRSQLVQQDTITESRKNGLTLWPGLSPLVLHGVGCPGPSLQSTAAKIPAWLDAAIGASRPCSLENGRSTGKVSKVTTDRRSPKNCTAHVYISRLIQDLQISESKERLPPQPNELKTPQEVQRQGILTANYDFDKVKKVLNGVTSINNVGSATAERNSNEARNGRLEHQRLHQIQQQAAVASRMHTLSKENFSFLSLSAGRGGVESTNSFNRTRNNGVEPSSQFQVSYHHSLAQDQKFLHSLAQDQKFMPHTMPQGRYTPSAYQDQLSSSATASAPQVHLQLPPYLSGPFLTSAHTSTTVYAKQQQQFWAAQLAAHCKPVGTSASLSQFPYWPNGRQDPTLIPCLQSIISPSPSSLEGPGPKYAPISHQQQQQLVAITSSLPSARVKRQDHHLPSAHEETEGGFRTGGSLPLQLLCNERL